VFSTINSVVVENVGENTKPEGSHITKLTPCIVSEKGT